MLHETGNVTYTMYLPNFLDLLCRIYFGKNDFRGFQISHKTDNRHVFKTMCIVENIENVYTSIFG